jgi:hypothetical protein
MLLVLWRHYMNEDATEELLCESNSSRPPKYGQIHKFLEICGLGAKICAERTLQK